MIITIEGTPASGKTRLGEYLVRQHDALLIAELNRAFLRPDPESVVWYLQRQVDRWARAIRSDRPDRLVVLDGDPYRPVWHGWIYPERAELPWREALGFFRDRLASIGLSRFYVHLQVRAEPRTSSARLEPQSAFFTALGQAFPGFVLPCQAGALPVIAETIRIYRPPAPVEGQAFLAFMEDWLETHSADQAT